MHLFVTKTDGWRDHDGVPVTRERGAFAGLVEGRPFFVDEEGRYDHLLNAWIDTLVERSRSVNTWQAYAGDVMRFLDFLPAWARTRGLATPHWTEVTQGILRDWHHVRQRQTGGPLRVKASTWNRELAALQSLYRFSQAAGAVAETPFRFNTEMVVNVAVGRNGDNTTEVVLRSNTLREGVEQRPPRYLTREEVHDFKWIGLAGMRLNSDLSARALPGLRYVDDPESKLRHVTRNLLFSDLHLTTGMRRVEGGTLLLWEVPPEAQARDAKGRARRMVVRDGREVLVDIRDVEVQLAQAICKGGVNARPVYVPRAVYRRLQRYIEVQRADHVAAKRQGGRGPYEPPPRAVLAEYVGRGQCRIDGTRGTMHIKEADAALRRRLVVLERGVPVGPAQVFVTERGDACAKKMWNGVFVGASTRCSEVLGREVDIAPHDLRHTYAVNMLQRLVEYYLQTADMKTLRENVGAAAYYRMARDPMETLMKRMGHKRMSSTMLYLEHLETVQDAAAEASARLAADFGLDGEDDS